MSLRRKVDKEEFNSSNKNQDESYVLEQKLQLYSML